MSTNQPPALGTCPSCTAPVRTFDVAIDGTSEEPAVLARCPRCRDVVHPDPHSESP